MDLKLKDKVVFITGGSKGIGYSIAQKFAEEGATVIVSARNIDAVNEAVANLEKDYGIKAKGYEHDVSSSEATAKIFEDIIATFGKIDVLVNNAGITNDNLMLKMSDEEWNSVIDINLNGVFYASREAIKYMMKARNGKIINMTSIVGITGNAGQANYTAAKAAVIALTKTTAKEMAARNIKVNAIAPGFIETDMTKKLSESVVEQMKSSIPLKRFGQVDDIANTTLFLASELSDYITGQTISVNGGMFM